MIKIIVSGAEGKMGQTTCTAINNQPEFSLVGKSTKNTNLKEMIHTLQPDIVIDFTTPTSVYKNCQIVIDSGTRLLVGTSGLTTEQISTLGDLCKQKSLGAIIAPNFSLGAILMMRYAQDAAKYLHDSEIIEMHHNNKLDKPSATAIKTAELMANNRKVATTPCASSSGDIHSGTPIHSVRLPGLFAHQSVIFGGTGEVLTIRHDSFTRESMMPGVILACRKLISLNDLLYGLENII